MKPPIPHPQSAAYTCTKADLLLSLFTKTKCKSSHLQVQWVQALLSVLMLLGPLLLSALNACQHQSKYRLTPSNMFCAVQDFLFFRLIRINTNMAELLASLNSVPQHSGHLFSHSPATCSKNHTGQNEKWFYTQCVILDIIGLPYELLL